MAELCSNFGDSAITKGQIVYFFYCICTKRLYFYYQSKIWRHARVPRPRFPIRWRNFGDSAKSKGQIAYFYCACAKRPYFYFWSKIWRHHRVAWPRFAITFRNFGDLVINKGQIAYISSLRMRETAIFLLPVNNPTSPPCCPTPISYKNRIITAWDCKPSEMVHVLEIWYGGAPGHVDDSPVWWFAIYSFVFGRIAL